MSNLATTLKKKNTTAVAGKKEAPTFMKLMKQMEKEIARALPKHVTPERMFRIAQTAYSSNPKLQECDPMSIIASVINASQMGLEPNTPLGQSYIIPYRNKGKMEAQFQIGYKGLLELAYRTKQYKMITAIGVDENDEFDYELGLTMSLKHKPASNPSGNITHYYAIYKTVSDGEGFVVMSREQIEAHSMKYSMAVQKGWTSPWKTDFDAMAKKTVLKELMKYAPKSIEFAQSLTSDETRSELSNDGLSTFQKYEDVEEADATITTEGGTTVDAKTGEVLEGQSEMFQGDSASK